MATLTDTADQIVPSAGEPPEARGLRRDAVRLLVSDLGGARVEHARFRDIERWISPGDVLVVNTSGTLNASLPATTPQGEELELHLSTALPGGFWTVEVRTLTRDGSIPHREPLGDGTLLLPSGGRATLLAPYPLGDRLRAPSRLWMAALELPEPTHQYLSRCGVPIRYSYVKQWWPTEMYQTIFARELGSAEMPSAGRPFSADVVTALVAAGVQIAPLLLHTGVASLEDHEPPYEEFYRVPRDTADRVNAARRAGHRVIAVGTTVVRALETVTDEHGLVSPGSGWTDLVISPSRPLRAVNGLISGLHEPRATHLMILEEAAISAARCTREAARAHLSAAYAEALARGYLWHEFGDSHLIIGRR